MFENKNVCIEREHECKYNITKVLSNNRTAENVDTCMKMLIRFKNEFGNTINAMFGAEDSFNSS